MPLSISEYVGSQPSSRSWSSRLTEEQRQLIRDAVAEGYGKVVIARWLRDEHGIADASASKVRTFLENEGLIRG